MTHASQQVDWSYTKCPRILKDGLELHPYCLQSIQEILRADEPLGRQFYQWFINHSNNDAFFTEEAWFHLSGYVNSQDMRLWSADNLHFYIETPLHSQKIGLWATVSRRRIVGPIFF
ncbi:hypothetical protein NQ318_006314 [Aromia moschata]|uniref:Uncharacterized protein n=1 Tax=Aromia moschata TaxID=1265417 RepID=A0AAV8YWX7_9CUCU|nr:hypothetical protein NQ318_006314 [Aromia moschata]